MVFRLITCLVILLPACAEQAAATGFPEWADKRAPKLTGLVLWLDASAQPPAARACGNKPVKNGDSLEYWFDASGHDRHLRQAVSTARPTLRLEGGIGAIRFNGRGANFSLDGLGLTSKNLTVFLVIAPLRNEGGFRGMVSMHAKGEDDFRSGINVDLGPYGSARFDVVNIEGAGTVGAQNLRVHDNPFAQFRRLCIATSSARQSVALYVDGQAEGTRTRSSLPMHMDEVIVGGRHYGGSEGPRGFFAGEIAEVLIYDKTLDHPERAVIDQYLAAKYKDAGPIPPLIDPAVPGTISRVQSPPAVQMLIPGFTVRELPVKLSNINNALYREDGVLVALGYDGNIHLLSDSDGDGIEDKDKLFWENKGQLIAPIGMSLTPPGYEHGRGVLVAAKGKCALIVDTDGDDRADKEIVVAEGWPETPHPVDALGAAFDPKDQAIFFLGLGRRTFRIPTFSREATSRGTI